MQLLTVVPGHTVPDGEFYELKAKQMIASSGEKL